MLANARALGPGWFERPLHTQLARSRVGATSAWGRRASVRLRIGVSAVSSSGK